jgi:hypothetical protein
VQDGLSPIEAEIRCAVKIADLPKPAAQLAFNDDPRPRERTRRRRDPRQLALNF